MCVIGRRKIPYEFFYGDLLERYVDMGKKRKATPVFSVSFALERHDTTIVYYICMQKIHLCVFCSTKLVTQENIEMKVSFSSIEYSVN